MSYYSDLFRFLPESQSIKIIIDDWNPYLGLWVSGIDTLRFIFQTHTSFFNELKYFSDTSSGIPWTNADG